MCVIVSGKEIRWECDGDKMSEDQGVQTESQRAWETQVVAWL